MTRRRLTDEERRQSRIKTTRGLILTRGLSGLLNNTKWFEIFDWIDGPRMEFEIKLLSESSPRQSNSIRELESTAVLVDDDGDFIEFLEIESLSFNINSKSIEYLKTLGVEYYIQADEVAIPGYKGIIQ